jgi:glycosyltransferase involved in cell wall biosynthesis
MKILFIHTIGKNKYGGGERWVINASAGLKEKGHDVFVGSMKGSVLLQKAEERGVKTVNFNIHSDVSLYMAVKIAFFIKRNKIDVIITKRRDIFVVGLAAKLSTKPLVIIRSGSPPKLSAGKHVSVIKKFAHGIITNTKTIKNYYLFKGLSAKGFVKVIYNGFHVDDSTPKVDFSEMFPNKKVILSVGRLAKEKAYHDLIDAAALLKRRRSDLVFYIIGEGKMYDELIDYSKRKHVDDIVHFAGYIDPASPYMKGCDVFLLTSIFEGMANSAMEALGYAKPVIMTNVNGAAELSLNGKYAMLIRPENPLEIADSVEKVLNKQEHYDKIALAAMTHIRENFTMNAMIDNVESFINERLTATDKGKKDDEHNW